MNKPKQHWDHIYSQTTDDSKLGWYEKDSYQTLKCLDMTNLKAPATIFLAGAGTSVLVEDLLSTGYRLIVNDVSSVALAALKNRIGFKGRPTWLEHDLTKALPDNLPIVDLWLDRAVLHFLLEEKQINDYFSNLESLVRPGGYALLAQFFTSAVAKCAGLDLHRYSIDELTRRTGEGFALMHHEIHEYTTPFGDPRPYLYALYKKRSDLIDGA